MPLFQRRDAGDDGWTVEPMGNGETCRRRVRMERLGNILPHHREVLEAAAREEGRSLEEYVAWVANLSSDRMHATRDRIMNGVAGEREATLYGCWLEARAAVQEVQYRIEVRPGKYAWRGR
ncbi:hypothetical protein ACYTFC_29635 [Streptomyces globosus]|jgi:hypothetical protein|nr:hypothetical protein [Streptomyces sp. WAC05292]RSS86359.1 hypothetical protein EF903_19075 [Streptomyces sp. WAC05292]